MTIITKQSQIAEASTADLLATYNALSGKSITRFSSRAAGEVQVANAILSAENAAGHAGVAKGAAPTALTQAELAARRAVKNVGDKLDDAPPIGKTHKKLAAALSKSNAALAGAFGRAAKKATRPVPALKKMAANLTAAKTPAARAAKTEASTSMKESWSDKEVRAARSLKQRVMADGTEYRSVAEAFGALDLPMPKHVKFRMELKAAGRATFEHLSVKHKFSIVEAS